MQQFWENIPVIISEKTASQMVSQSVFITYCLEINSCFSLMKSEKWLSGLSPGKERISERKAKSSAFPWLYFVSKSDYILKIS